MSEQLIVLLQEERASEGQIRFARRDFERELKNKGYDFTWSKDGMCYEDFQTRQAFSMFFRGFQCGWEME